MKQWIYPLIVLLLSACSGLSGVEEGVKGEEVEELTSVYISRCSASSSMEVPIKFVERFFPSDAFMQVKKDAGGKQVDLVIHYEFPSENGGSMSETFDLYLKSVPFSKEGTKMCFNITSLTGIVSIGTNNSEIPFTDVSVSGMLTLLPDALSTDLSISGFLNGYPFKMVLEKLSTNKPEFPMSGEICGDPFRFMISFTNDTAKEITVELRSVSGGNVAESIHLDVGETSSFYSHDNLLQLYVTVISPKGGDPIIVDNWEDLSLSIARDFCIGNFNGTIKPHFFTLLTNIVKDGFLDSTVPD